MRQILIIKKIYDSNPNSSEVIIYPKRILMKYNSEKWLDKNNFVYDLEKHYYVKEINKFEYLIAFVSDNHGNFRYIYRWIEGHNDL